MVSKYTPMPHENKGSWKGQRGDGEWIPEKGSPLHTALQKFNSNKPMNEQVHSIAYKDGFPDYSKVIFKGPKGTPGRVEIVQAGGAKDFAHADEAYAALIKDPDWVRPPGYTWHHCPDGVTMELVPTKIHGAPTTSHSGGTSLLKNPEY
jgi:hypothetical protein